MQLHHRVADWLRTHSIWANALFLLVLAAFTTLVTVSSPAQMACGPFVPPCPPRCSPSSP